MTKIDCKNFDEVTGPDGKKIDDKGHCMARKYSNPVKKTTCLLECPFYTGDRPPIGLGDVLHKWFKRLGFKTKVDCGCQQRRSWLNKLWLKYVKNK